MAKEWSGPAVRRSGDRDPGARPSWGWYLVSVVIALAAAGVFASHMFSSLSGISDALIRFEGPGESVVEIAAPGAQTLFIERRSEVAGNRLETTAGPEAFADVAIEAVAVDAPAARATLAPVGMGARYSFHGVEGVAVATLTFPSAGRYRITVERIDNRRQRVAFALGSDFTAGLATTILTGFAIMFTGLGASIFLFVRTWRRRAA